MWSICVNLSWVLFFKIHTINVTIYKLEYFVSAGFAPFIDGTILVNPTSAPPSMGSSTIATSSGYELADFPDRDLLVSLTSTESYLDLNAQDLEFGFNETKRDRVLRTYVRNAYYFHLNEIFSTLKNEYTDWERPSQNPLSVRDATLDVLSDGHTVSPLIRIGYLHSLSGGKTFFLHFQHHGSEKDLPQVSLSDQCLCFPVKLMLEIKQYLKIFTFG